MLQLSFIGQKTLWEKKKMLVTSIFFFSHYVFKRLFRPVGPKSSLCGKEVTKQQYLGLVQIESVSKEKLIVAKMIISVIDRVEKNCGKRRKCWLPVFYPFPPF